MVAYLILAHKNLHQVTRLIGRLAGERVAFFVHIDAKTDISAHEAELRSLPGVELAGRRHVSPWGEFGLVRATLDLMASALRSAPEVSRLTLLSGQDYPIKPPERIEAFLLDEHPERSFIEHRRLPEPDWPGGGMALIEDWHVRLAGSYRSLRNSRLGIRRSLPYGLAPFQGGQYWSMSRACAEYVLGFAREHPRLVRFFRHAGVPDESFFQTIVMNSPMASAVVNTDLRFERWESGGSHSLVLTTADVPAIRESPALFAKKFDTDLDAEVLDHIDREILAA